MIIGLAVWSSLALEEVARAQLLGTVVAGEMLWMPGLAQRRDHLADDGLVARGATALLRRIHALSVHLGRQAPEHAVQWRSRVHRFSGVACRHWAGHL